VRGEKTPPKKKALPEASQIGWCVFEGETPQPVSPLPYQKDTKNFWRIGGGRYWRGGEELGESSPGNMSITYAPEVVSSEPREVEKKGELESKIEKVSNVF